MNPGPPKPSDEGVTPAGMITIAEAATSPSDWRCPRMMTRCPTASVPNPMPVETRLVKIVVKVVSIFSVPHGVVSVIVEGEPLMALTWPRANGALARWAAALGGIVLGIGVPDPVELGVPDPVELGALACHPGPIPVGIREIVVAVRLPSALRVPTAVMRVPIGASLAANVELWNSS